MIAFKARLINYYKRREPTPTHVVKTVTCPDFEFIHYHTCEMHVEYEDGEQVVLRGQVLNNPVKKDKWSVSGHDTNYNHVIADVITE